MRIILPPEVRKDLQRVRDASAGLTHVLDQVLAGEWDPETLQETVRELNASLEDTVSLTPCP